MHSVPEVQETMKYIIPKVVYFQIPDLQYATVNEFCFTKRNLRHMRACLIPPLIAETLKDASAKCLQ